MYLVYINLKLYSTYSKPDQYHAAPFPTLINIHNKIARNCAGQPFCCTVLTVCCCIELVFVSVHLPPGYLLHQVPAAVHRPAAPPRPHLRRDGPPPPPYHLRRRGGDQTECSRREFHPVTGLRYIDFLAIY